MNDSDSSENKTDTNEQKDDLVTSGSTQAEGKGTPANKNKQSFSSNKQSFSSNKQSFSSNKNLIGVGIAAVVIVLGGLFLLMRSNDESSQISEQVSPGTQNQKSSSQQDVLPESTDEAEKAVNVVEFTVEGSPFKFVPSQLNVKQGDTVRITFKNIEGFHDFVLPEFDIATKQLAAGNEETVEFTAEKAGEFEFYCSVANNRDMGMSGTLVVE